MFVFIDESGDCGVVKERVSAPQFTLAAVHFGTAAGVESCAEAIRRLRRELGLDERHEFHFKGAAPARRRSFLSAVARQDFRYVAVTLHKEGLDSKRWRDKEFFYGQVGGRLVALLEPLIVAPTSGARRAPPCKPTMDHNDDPVYVEAIRQQFKKRNGPDGRPLFAKVRTSRSDASDALQLADMICGAIVRAYRGEDTYRDLVQEREADWDVWRG
ncbi:MAG TPA: DUF3800 domain-containing protein [Streptosporangiaceae bacterium]|nr:DUF3800 domain-containing protein [Streptosporangiaceae bacterium]